MYTFCTFYHKMRFYTDKDTDKP